MSIAKERMEKAARDYHVAVAQNEKIREALKLLQESKEKLSPLSDYYFDQWLNDVQELNETDFSNEVMNQDAIYEEVVAQYELMKKILLVCAQYINETEEAE